VPRSIAKWVEKNPNNLLKKSISPPFYF